MPEEEQLKFACLLLTELESGRQWADLFPRPELDDLRERLADEASSSPQPPDAVAVKE